MELSTERVVQRDSDVIDGRLRILVKLLVYTNGVIELDGCEGREVWDDCIGYIRNVASVALKDLDILSESKSHRRRKGLLVSEARHNGTNASRHLLVIPLSLCI